MNAFETPSAYRNTSTGGDIYSRTGGHVGGWPSKEAAMDGLAEDQRLGVVICVIENGIPVEYWWKEGIELEHLVEYNGEPALRPIGQPYQRYRDYKQYEIVVDAAQLVYAMVLYDFTAQYPQMAGEHNNNYNLRVLARGGYTPSTQYQTGGAQTPEGAWVADDWYVNNVYEIVDNHPNGKKHLTFRTLQNSSFSGQRTKQRLIIPAGSYLRVTFPPEEFMDGVTPPNVDGYFPDATVLEYDLAPEMTGVNIFGEYYLQWKWLPSTDGSGGGGGPSAFKNVYQSKQDLIDAIPAANLTNGDHAHIWDGGDSFYVVWWTQIGGGSWSREAPNGTGTPPDDTLALTTFYPSSGPSGTEVIIFGTGFGQLVPAMWDSNGNVQKMGTPERVFDTALQCWVSKAKVPAGVDFSRVLLVDADNAIMAQSAGTFTVTAPPSTGGYIGSLFTPGATLKFDRERIWGTINSPINSDLSLDMTDAILGVVGTFIHYGTAPASLTSNPRYIHRGGMYAEQSWNEIMFRLIDDYHITYSITPLNVPLL